LALNRLRVGLGHYSLGLDEDCRARPAVEQRGGIGERLAQQVALGPRHGWAGVA
jgi:hypothetical protein